MYDLSIHLLSNAKRVFSFSSTKNDIIDQIEEQKEKFCRTRSVLNNAEVLIKKRGEIINQFTKKNIISRGEKFFDVPKKIEKSTPKNPRRFILWADKSVKR